MVQLLITGIDLYATPALNTESIRLGQRKLNEETSYNRFPPESEQLFHKQPAKWNTHYCASSINLGC
ncbi:hypothetical protein SAMN05216302_1001128 [Nitrosomonas aestuarii]|uniref:Uncharacterized protein n=1 Tax=Nitrosomonas aestuarii TaxID=52441 RepID=A0A1I3X7L6_9PROT|nr:hypothetical protein [Nitrosomonas aestuarii]SFK14861.1 hypothetical protein SAMN05216302_1001128 [Nitrosomonas aestuarii]